MKEVFDLCDKLIFAKILFLASASFLRATIVSVNAAITFGILSSNGAATRSAFHEAKKSEVVFPVWSHFTALRHNFLTFIKKFL
ncbi:MAG: hypothetical protein A2750_01750 [Candidatus Yanofskybacteria bacterium RIFCSPHIGHO2_01_FULL_45_42]|uniref:Uncharacterized protein n=1 Tax=Candidatus Yanofskybacteria bacterium RIFCSPHIGHO2_01_FULL_45_42 TaxID=1802671 RepID=A0A1F8EYF7_9BACT|nr:MAG: hypothetical protein A2750_01750 [Candidatus Yanofskybacteria bacterium RIFCSPHIGHO2_01_FULL_45_42]